MFEELLEDIAQKNGLREVNTHIKLAAGLGVSSSASSHRVIFLRFLLPLSSRLQSSTLQEWMQKPMGHFLLCLSGLLS